MDRYDPTQPLPTFNRLLPKVDTRSFLPSFGSSSGFSLGPRMRTPDLSFSGGSFLNGIDMGLGMLGGWGKSLPTGFGGGNMSAPAFSLPGSQVLDNHWVEQTGWGATFVPKPVTTPGGTSGGIGVSAGSASPLNAYDAAFKAAGSKYGIDPNWLKAIATEEGGWADPVSGAGALGIMQIMPGGYPEGESLYPNWQGDPAQNIMLGAYILSQKIKDTGSLEAGTQAYLGSGVDPYTGISTDQYLASIQGYYNDLKKSTPAGGTPGTSANVINIASSFVGKVPYVLGGIPGFGETPTSWDCSGFMYWLDQNYGDKTLKVGSHYQYQDAVSRGALFMDMGQLKPGDLMYFDTDDTTGGGADLNRAGHVAMYIGNGKIVQALNPDAGTVISDLSDYYTSRFIGAEHRSWSG